MRNFLLLPAAALLLAASLTGCRKENGIDNNQVIQRPYSLYYSDMAGALHNANNADSSRIVFVPDGVPDRAIVTSSNNIIWVKNNVFLSENNGKAFNPTYLYTPLASTASWQSMILNVPDHGRIYIAANPAGSPSGIAYSDDNGKKWVPDTMFVPGITLPNPSQISSFAQTQNGVLYACDYVNAKYYIRLSKASRWAQFSPSSLPATGKFYLTHIQNSLVAVDSIGTQGAWHSEDTGRNWAQYAGLPTNTYLISANAPFDRTLLIGSTQGIFRLEDGKFVTSNTGLDEGTIVRGIVGKSNVYKNGIERRYIYIATSNGIYRSEDEGRNWVKVFRGNYNRIY